MVASADELNGYRRSLLCTPQALLDFGRGLVEACPYYGSVWFYSVVGILALVGYALETARVTAWASTLVQQKDLKFGTYIVTGFAGSCYCTCIWSGIQHCYWNSSFSYQSDSYPSLYCCSICLSTVHQTTRNHTAISVYELKS